MNHTSQKTNDQSRATDNWRQESVRQGNSQQSSGDPRMADSTSSNWSFADGMDMMGDQWNQALSQIKQHWPQLRDQDLQETQGNFDHLCNLIQQRTGESRQSIEHELRQLIDRQPESEGRVSMGSTGGSTNYSGSQGGYSEMGNASSMNNPTRQSESTHNSD